jgi:hypothetical protein
MNRLGAWLGGMLSSVLVASFAAMPCIAQQSASTVNGQLSAQIVAWGQANVNAYAEAMGASRVPVGAVPVPPQIDSPCNLCGQQNAVANGSQLAQAWVDQAMQPEVNYAATLLTILKTAEANQELDINTLTPEAKAVVYQYNPWLIQAAIKRLGNHLVKGKAIPMAQQNLGDRRRSYPGILYLLEAGKKAALIDADPDAVQQAMTLAQQWEQNVVDQIDSDIRQGHQYNLCPSYLLLLRQLALLGADSTTIHVEDIANKIAEWQKLLYFDVTMNLHVSGHSSKGSMNADWEGKGKFEIALDSNGGCFRPQMVGGVLHISMQPYDFQWTQHDKDGDVEIQYKGPSTFDLPMNNMVQLDLCDPQPVLQLPLAGTSSPIETYEGKGTSFQNMFFGSFLSAVAQANHTNRIETNQMTGKSYSSSPGGVLTPLTGGSSAGNGSSQSADNQNDVLAPLLPPVSSNGSQSSSSVANDPVAPLLPDYPGDPTLAPLTSSDSSSSSSQGSADPYTRYQEANQKIAAHMGDTAWVQSAEGRATLTEAKQAFKDLQSSNSANAPASNSGAPSRSNANAGAQDNSASAQIEAHKGDAGWLMSAEGQAALAQMQQQAMAKLQAKLNAAGVVVPKEANASSLAAAVMSVQLPWTNGQVEPVNQTLHVQKNGNTIELKISVRQAPQQ